jgi:G-patch domain
MWCWQCCNISAAATKLLGRAAETCRPASCAGLQLLRKMGWRQGRGIGAAVSTGRGRGGSRWGRTAGAAPDPVPVFAPPSKGDRHGLGFDPFKVRRVPRVRVC